jgi:hypothetical protein
MKITKYTPSFKTTNILKLIIQNNVAKKIYIPPIVKGAL